MAIFLLVQLTNFAVTITYRRSECVFKRPNDHDWAKCDASVSHPCADPAAQVEFTFNPSGEDFNMQLTCPWSNGTYITSFSAIAFSLALFLVIKFSQAYKSKKIITISIVFGLGAIALAVGALILMLFDILHGRDSKDDYNDDSLTNLKVDQTMYIISAVCVFFSILLSILFTLNAFKEHSKTNNRGSLINENDDRRNANFIRVR